MKRLMAMLLTLMLLTASCAFAEETASNDVYKPEIGDHFLFGRWEQDNDETNGYEPLEWMVLDQDGDNYFVISYRCIEVAIFYPERVARYWGNSDLRPWMNTTWKDELFTAEEQQFIQLTTVQNTNPFGIRGAGDDTEDYLYLLSRTECMKYFPDQASRVAYPTEHAKAQGCTLSPKTGSTRWWLRTPGARRCDVQGIRLDGRFTSYGMQDVDWPTNCLRPVMWLNWTEDLGRLMTPVAAE